MNMMYYILKNHDPHFVPLHIIGHSFWHSSSSENSTLTHFIPFWLHFEPFSVWTSFRLPLHPYIPGS
jgi:hypothetical protein